MKQRAEKIVEDDGHRRQRGTLVAGIERAISGKQKLKGGEVHPAKVRAEKRARKNSAFRTVGCRGDFPANPPMGAGGTSVLTDGAPDVLLLLSRPFMGRPALS